METKRTIDRTPDTDGEARAEAGSREPADVAGSPELAALFARVNHAEADAKAMELKISVLNQTIAQLNARFLTFAQEARESLAHEYDATIAQLQVEQGEKLEEIERLTQRIRELEEANLLIQESIEVMRSRLGYRFLERLRGIAQAMAPEGSLRGRCYNSLLRGIQYLGERGPIFFVLRLLQPWKWLPRLRRS